MIENQYYQELTAVLDLFNTDDIDTNLVAVHYDRLTEIETTYLNYEYSPIKWPNPITKEQADKAYILKLAYENRLLSKPMQPAPKQKHGSVNTGAYLDDMLATNPHRYFNNINNF